MGPNDFYKLKEFLNKFLERLVALDADLDEAEDAYKKRINDFHIKQLKNLLTFISLSFHQNQKLSIHDAEFKIRALVILHKVSYFLNSDPRVEKFIKGLSTGIDGLSAAAEMESLSQKILTSLDEVKDCLDLLNNKLSKYVSSQKYSLHDFLFSHHEHSYIKKNPAILFSLIISAEPITLETNQNIHSFLKKLNYQGWLEILCRAQGPAFDLLYGLYSSINENLLKNIDRQSTLYGEHFEAEAANIGRVIETNLKFANNPASAFSIYTIYYNFLLCLRQKQIQKLYEKRFNVGENSEIQEKKYTDLLVEELNRAKEGMVKTWANIKIDPGQLIKMGNFTKLWKDHIRSIEGLDENSAGKNVNEELKVSFVQKQNDSPDTELNQERSRDNLNNRIENVVGNPLVNIKENTKNSPPSSPWSVDDTRLLYFVKDQIKLRSPKRFGWFLGKKTLAANDLTSVHREDSTNTCENVLRNGKNIVEIEQIFKKSSKEFSFFRKEISEDIYKEMTHVRRSYSAVYFLERILKEISTMDFKTTSMFSRRKNVRYKIHEGDDYINQKSKLPAFFAEVVDICKTGLTFKKERTPYRAFLEVQQKLFRYCNEVERSKHRHVAKAKELLDLIMPEKVQPLLDKDKTSFYVLLNIAVEPSDGCAQEIQLKNFYAVIKPFLSRVENSISLVKDLDKEKSNFVDYVCYKLFEFAENHFSKSQKKMMKGAYQTVMNQIMEIFICNKVGSNYAKISENPSAYFKKEFEKEQKYYRSIVKYLESNHQTLVENKPRNYDYSISLGRNL